MRIYEVDRKLSQTELDQLEIFADRLFAKVGIDVEFTRHFLDRVNDERNVKQITASELTRLFKQEHKRWGKQIAQLGPDSEAVLKDLATDVNIPFALRWDNANNELDLIAKTVMRKNNFKTSNKEFQVNSFNFHSDSKQSKMIMESIEALMEGMPAVDLFNNMNPADFQQKYGVSKASANQSVGKVTQLFPDKFKNNPRIRVNVSNYFIKNPAMMKQLIAANDNVKPPKLNWKNLSKLGLKAIPRIFGGVILNIITPSTLGDGTLKDEQLLQWKIQQDYIKSDPQQAMQDIIDWYKTTKKYLNDPDGYKDDFDYQTAQGYRNDEIVKSLDGVIDPGLKKAADDLADKLRKAKNQQAIDDLIGKVDPALQKAANEVAPEVNTLSPKALLSPEVPEDLGLYPQPETDVPPVYDALPQRVPEPGDPEILPANDPFPPKPVIVPNSPKQPKAPEIPSDTPVEIPDTDKPKVIPFPPSFPTQPEEEPFPQGPEEEPVEPKKEPGPDVKPNAPKQPVIPTEPENPEVPEPTTDPDLDPDAPEFPDAPEKPDEFPDEPKTDPAPGDKPDIDPNAPTQPEPGTEPENPEVPEPTTDPDLDPDAPAKPEQPADPDPLPSEPKTDPAPGNKPEVDPEAPAQPKAPAEPESPEAPEPTTDPDLDPKAPPAPEQPADPDAFPDAPKTDPAPGNKPEVDPEAPAQPEPGPEIDNPVAPDPATDPGIDTTPLPQPELDPMPSEVPSVVPEPVPGPAISPAPGPAIAPKTKIKPKPIKPGLKPRRAWDWGGTSDKYKTNLYKWTQKYGTFENTNLINKYFTLNEGGAMPGVGAIHIDEIKPTLDMLEKSLGIDLNNFTLGSVGKRQFSGDIDVALNLPPEELPAFVEKLKKNPLIKDIAKSSVIMTKVEIQNFNKEQTDGRPRTGFVQVDFMPGDPGWMKTYYHSPSEDESKYKGVFRNIMIASMAAVLDRQQSDAKLEDGRSMEELRYMWSPTEGLLRVKRTPVPNKAGTGYTKKNQNETIDGPWKQSDEIAKVLKLDSGKDLNSFESLLTAMNKNWTKEAAQTVIKAFKDNHVVNDIGMPDELK